MVIWAWSPPGNEASRKHSCTVSKGPVRLLATQPEDFAFQVSFISSVFTFKWIFSDSMANPLSGFSFISVSFVCLGQEDDKEVKLDDFSEVYERLVQKHGWELPDFKLSVWARMLVSC